MMFDRLLKYTPYLIFLAVFFGVAGLVVSTLVSVKSPVAIVFLILTLLSLIGWVIGFTLKPKFWESRFTQAGTNALISTFSVFIILALINYIIVQQSWSIDLTENRLFTLSSSSQTLVKSIGKPLNILIFDKQNNPDDQQLLDQYRRYNSNIKYQWIDPELKPTLAQKYKVTELGQVYLDDGNKTLLVQTLKQGERLSENHLSNAIIKIIQTKQPTLYILEGHGELSPNEGQENSLSQAIKTLKDQNYQIKSLNLADVSEIPKDADVILVAGVKRPLLEGETNSLKTYLDNGGSLFVLIDPETEPNLTAIWEEWGIKLDQRVIIDASGKGSVIGLGPATPLITHYGTHPITKKFEGQLSFYPYSRPINTIEKAGITVSPLLVTDSQSWAESNIKSQDSIYNPDQDLAGPLNLGVALEKPVSNNNTSSSSLSSETDSSNNSSNSNQTNSSLSSSSFQSEKSSNSSTLSETNSSLSSTNTQENSKKVSRLVVIGNSTFATNGWFDKQLNGDVFINSVKWLAKSDDNLLSIREKSPKNRRINLSPFQGNLIFLLGVIIIPLTGLITAVVTWWKRR